MDVRQKHTHTLKKKRMNTQTHDYIKIFGSHPHNLLNESMGIKPETPVTEPTVW
jgi:hypothetical protein